MDINTRMWIGLNCKKKAKNKLGFTTIELVMVMVIAGILAVAAAAKFATQSTYTNRFFYDDIISSIRYAQIYAVGTGCHIQVSVTASTLTLAQAASCSTGAFSVGVVDPNNPGATSYTRTAPSGSGLTITGITGDWPIYFDALGRAHRADNSVGNNPNPYTLTVGERNISVIGETGFTQ